MHHLFRRFQLPTLCVLLKICAKLLYLRKFGFRKYCQIHLRQIHECATQNLPSTSIISRICAFLTINLPAGYRQKLIKTVLCTNIRCRAYVSSENKEPEILSNNWGIEALLFSVFYTDNSNGALEQSCYQFTRLRFAKRFLNYITCSSLVIQTQQQIHKSLTENSFISKFTNFKTI